MQLGQQVCFRGCENPHTSHTLPQRACAGLKFRQHSSRDRRVRNQPRNVVLAQRRNHAPRCVPHSIHVGKERQHLRATRHRAGRRHFIRVDVVVFAVFAQRNRCQHRYAALPPNRFQPSHIGVCDLSDKTKIAALNFFLSRAKHPSVAAAKAKHRHSRMHHRGNQPLVHKARQYHQRNVARGGISHA